MNQKIAKGSLVILLLIAACFLSSWILNRITFSVCGFHYLTGQPCPFCGGTRSLAALSHFNFKEAFLWNPLVMIVCLASLIIFPAQLFSNNVKKFLQKISWGKIFLILIFLNWMYLIWRA